MAWRARILRVPVSDWPAAMGGPESTPPLSTRMPVGTEIQTEADVEAMLAASRERTVFLFKHSLACGASALKVREVAALEAEADASIYTVVVQRARGMSNALAQRFGVRHETPQVIVIRDGRAVLHLSHSAIVADRLRDAARGVLGAS